MKRATITLSVALILALSGPTNASARDQRISLNAGWNLIAFSVTPEDPAVEVVFEPLIKAGTFEALWTYDAQRGGIWSGRVKGAMPPGVESIDEVETGKGYWLKVTAAPSSPLIISGTDAIPPSAPGILEVGWNLVGFPSEEGQRWDKALQGAPVTEIWTYDAVAGVFHQVAPATGLNKDLPPENLQPSQGYWVLMTQRVSVAPILGTSLPSDIDVPPLLTNVTVDGADFNPKTPGDIDFGDDGHYDRPSTQRTMEFSDVATDQSFSIYNAGSGVLVWAAEIDQPRRTSWLSLNIGNLDSDGTPVDAVTGEVATGESVITVSVDRTGLGPGPQTGRIVIRSNGNAGVEAERVITVKMTVPDVVGDYIVTAHIDDVDGRPADTADPKIFVSLYRDRDGLKGKIDATRSLLFPQSVGLVGDVYRAKSTAFTVSGSFELPSAHKDNPYGVPLRRDVTLIGRRLDRGDAPVRGVGPLDLVGEYYETIRGVLTEPISLVGVFTARRISPAPTVTDLADSADGEGNIPDDGTPLIVPVHVDERLLISDIDVSVNIEHPLPSDLIVTLQSPAETEVILRKSNSGPTRDVRYDATATPFESLALFSGELSEGDWVLKVVDAVRNQQAGSLEGVRVHVAGTRVFRLSGTVRNVGAGATVILTGCGRTVVATTDASGRYAFDNLIECKYRVAVQKSGFARAFLDVIVAGDNPDITATSLEPSKQAEDGSTYVELPQGPAFRFLSLSTSGGAGALRPTGQTQYALDSATFDIDRPPLNASAPGPEDTDAFTDEYDPKTRTNKVSANGNGQIDGPVIPPGSAVGSQHRHGFFAIGQPVTGQSVYGRISMHVGAQP